MMKLIEILGYLYLIGIGINCLGAIFLMKDKTNQEYIYTLICILGWPIFLFLELKDRKEERDEQE